MLSRRYVERRIEKRGFWNPNNGRVYVEGIGLLQTTPDTLAEAVCLCFAYECQVVYLMPSRGKWKDQRGQYPGKADWEKSGLDLSNYYRNHSASIRLAGGEFEIDIVPVGAWFSSVTEESYMSDVIKGMATLRDLLTKHFQPRDGEYRVELLSTPARTGMDLLRRKLPYDAKYEDLPEEVEHILMTQFGQARTELFDHGQEQVTDLHNYDGLWMYASCCWHMPAGRIIHDFLPDYVPYCTGFYRVETRVPDSWQHIGLFPVRQESKTIWPNQPGTLFRSWCGYRDVALAREYGWQVTILERILWPDTEAKGVGRNPLLHWVNALVHLRQEIVLQYPEPIRSFLRDAFRALLNMTIGRFHMGAKTVDVYTADFSEYPGDNAILAEEYDNGSFRYEKKEALNNYQQEGFKPHWALAVWKMAQWKVTKAALSVPYDKLLSIRTDGLWTTCPVEFENTNKPGCFREKELVNRGPFHWPKGDIEFVDMIRKARGENG
jgi:hypothetical protein